MRMDKKEWKIFIISNILIGLTFFLAGIMF